MDVNDFLFSDQFKALTFPQQFDFKDLIMELHQLKLSFVIIKNQNNLVFKISKLYEVDNNSKCNIATIHIQSNNAGILVEPYCDKDNTKYDYSENKTFLLDQISSIYQVKISK
jgi:hypothetical protein